MKIFISRNWRTLGIIFSMAVGIFFPQLHSLGFIMRYLIMTMLFLAFMKLTADTRVIHRSHAYLLIASPVIAFAAYFAIAPFDRDIALAAFLTAMTPTATASPVVTGLLGGNSAYTAFMVFASSVSQPLMISFALPHMLAGKEVSGLGTILLTILSAIAIPYAIAKLVNRFLPRTTAVVKKFQPFSFVMWICALCLATAQASHFLRGINAPHMKLYSIAAITLLICIINFTVGRRIGGKDHPIEASQSLGQKNTIFTIWVALTFVSPLAALGPAFYILCHNSWNALQMHFVMRKKHQSR